MPAPDKRPPEEIYWHAPRMWEGEDVFIIGGGPSLVDFDWEPLKNKHLIGCNDAYQLGDWVDVCYWGDYGWWELFWRDEVLVKEGRQRHTIPGLLRYPGLCVTCNPACLDKDERVHVLEKRPVGIYVQQYRVGWNFNTGISAINLAALFGASRIILLGFDMKHSETGESNWHKNLKDKPSPDCFRKFMKFARLYAAPQMKERFPGVEVLNATPGSALELFPKAKLEDVL